jgi:hypothetical protein
MSATVPIAPAEPTKTPSQLIGDAQDGLDLLAKADANPQLDVFLRDRFGAQFLAAANTPFGSFLGLIVPWLIAYYGLKVDPSYIPFICGAGVLIGHYIQAGIVKASRWWRTSTVAAKAAA